MWSVESEMIVVNCVSWINPQRGGGRGLPSDSGGACGSFYSL
jgi:hypothetical protein